MTTFPLVPLDEWNRMDASEQLQRLLGMTTARVLEYLTPSAYDNMHPTFRNNQMQAIRAVLHTCTKLGIESKRLADVREQVLGDLIEGLGERAKGKK